METKASGTTAMETLHELLEDLQRQNLTAGHFLGLLHLLIGRRIARAEDGAVIANGLTWREVAAALKKVRWEKDDVRELGLDPDALAPRDRERYWYMAIARAQVDSAKARDSGEELARLLVARGYLVSNPVKKGEG